MDIELLTIFITLSEKLHFRETSDHHHLTPSALSRMIQRLEESVGAPLFARTKRHVRLTDQGRQFLIFATQTVSAYQAFQNKLHQNDPSKLYGELKFYSTVTAAYTILPSLIKAFRKKHPNITTYLETGGVQHSYKKLNAHEIDFSVSIITPRMTQLFNVHKVTETPLVFIAPKEQALATLSNTPMLLPESGDLADLILDTLDKNKLSPTIHSYIQGHEAILAMVSAGLGGAILPQLVVNNSHLKSKIKVIQTDITLPVIEVGILCKRSEQDSASKQAFWNFISSQ